MCHLPPLFWPMGQGGTIVQKGQTTITQRKERKKERRTKEGRKGRVVMSTACPCSLFLSLYLSVSCTRSAGSLSCVLAQSNAHPLLIYLFHSILFHFLLSLSPSSVSIVCFWSPLFFFLFGHFCLVCASFSFLSACLGVVLFVLLFVVG